MIAPKVSRIRKDYVGLPGMGAVVIIAGGRDFDDYELMVEQARYFMRNLDDVKIISGGNKVWNPVKQRHTGADLLAAKLAKEKNIPFKEYPADWKQHGIKAGWIRNREMGEAGTHLLAFWDGKSRGTKMMIEIARSKNIPTEIISY